MLGPLESTLSDMQGQLFEMSADLGLDSPSFFKAFMNSRVASKLDAPFDFLQWADKKYVMEAFLDEAKEKLRHGGTIYDKETLFWSGYIYRVWHYETEESSKDIYKQAKAKDMRIVYYPYHCLSVKMAIARLKETCQAKKGER